MSESDEDNSCTSCICPTLLLCDRRHCVFDDD